MNTVGVAATKARSGEGRRGLAWPALFAFSGGAGWYSDVVLPCYSLFSLLCPPVRRDLMAGSGVVRTGGKLAVAALKGCQGLC